MVRMMLRYEREMESRSDTQKTKLNWVGNNLRECQKLESHISTPAGFSVAVPLACKQEEKWANRMPHICSTVTPSCGLCPVYRSPYKSRINLVAQGWENRTLSTQDHDAYWREVPTPYPLDVSVYGRVLL